MKLSGDFEFKLLLAAVAVAAVGIIVYRASRAAGDIAGKAVDAVNPFNNDNIINQGATSLWQGMTGSTGTIGTDAAGAVIEIKRRLDETNKQMAEDGFGWPI